MSESRTGPEKLHEVVLRDTSADLPDARRSILATGLTLLAACVFLFLAWLAAPLALLAPYSNVIDEVGPCDNDELPRPLGPQACLPFGRSARQLGLRP